MLSLIHAAAGALDHPGIVPIYEVNLTRLANWFYEGNVTVTDEPIADGTEETYSRGLATYNPLGASDTTISVSIEASNSGLTDTRAIDPRDAEINLSDSIMVADVSDLDTIIITGQLSLAGQISS